MKNKRSIIIVLFIGWVSGAGSWYFITQGQAPAGEFLASQQRQGEAPSATLSPFIDEVGVDLPAVFPPPVEPGNLSGASDQSVLPPADMPEPLMAARNEADASSEDGVVQDTGKFIDVDDPQAYVAYWDRQSDGVVHDTGEFIAVDAWQVP